MMEEINTHPQPLFRPRGAGEGDRPKGGGGGAPSGSRLNIARHLPRCAGEE